MLGISISQENIDFEIINNELNLNSDAETLASELWLFCAIRKGEVFYDKNMGLNHELILEGDEERVRNHVNQQILKYFSEYIKSINYINVEFIDYAISINFEITSIFGIIKVEGGI